MNRHEKILLLAMIILNDELKKHRENCHNWSYSPNLKRALTNCIKLTEECIHKLPGEIYENDYKLIGNKLEKFQRCKAFIGKDIIKESEFQELPVDFMDEVAPISNTMIFIDETLKLTIDRNIKDEYKKLMVWYGKFDDFLKEEIFI